MVITDPVERGSLDVDKTNITSGNESKEHLAMKLDIARDLLADGWVVGVEEEALGQYYVDILATRDSTTKVVEIGNVSDLKLELLKQEFDEVENVPYITESGEPVWGESPSRGGRQVYISDKYWHKLKLTAANRDKTMKGIVEQFIEQLEVKQEK